MFHSDSSAPPCPLGAEGLARAVPPSILGAERDAHDRLDTSLFSRVTAHRLHTQKKLSKGELYHIYMLTKKAARAVQPQSLLEPRVGFDRDRRVVLNPPVIQSRSTGAIYVELQRSKNGFFYKRV